MRADRLLSLMLSLQAEGRITAQALAARLEVSERTIYRDVEALCIAGIPIYTQSGTHGGIYLDEHYRVSLTGLSSPELRSLFVAGDVGPLADLGLAKAAEGMVLKLFAALPDVHRREVEQLRQRFYIDTANWFQYGAVPSVLPLLQQAVWEDRVVTLDYADYEGHVSQPTVNALALVAKANIWYFVGCKADESARTYRVSRIQDLLLGVERFERDPAFDLAAYWTQASQNFEQQKAQEFPFYPVILATEPFALAYFQDYMPDRFEQLEPPDVAGRVLLRVLFLSALEAKMCVLGLGTQVAVMEPDEVRQAVIETAREIVARERMLINQSN